MELAPSRTVGDPAGQAEEAAADRLRDERPGDLESERADPSEEVVGDRREHRPGAVRAEVPRWAVRKTRALLHVPDRELHDGVAAVIGIEGDRITDPVGDEGVVAEGREQRGLRVDKLGAPDDETVTVAISGLGDPGLPALGLVDSDEGLLRDRIDRPLHAGVLRGGDRIANVMAPAGLHDVL